MSMSDDLKIEYQGNKEGINRVKEILKRHLLKAYSGNDYIWGNQSLSLAMGIDDEYSYPGDELLFPDTEPTLLMAFKPYNGSKRNLSIEGNILMHEIIYDICELFSENNCMMHFQNEIFYYEQDVNKFPNKYKKLLLNEINIDDIKPDNYTFFDGSERALFLYWAFQKGFLKEEIKQKVNLYSKDILPLNNDKLLKMMKSSIGNIFISDLYLKEYRIFCMVYTMIMNGSFYDLNMYTNIGTLYTNLTDFSQLDESSENYSKLFNMFDRAYDDYVSNIELWQ